MVVSLATSYLVNLVTENCLATRLSSTADRSMFVEAVRRLFSNGNILVFVNNVFLYKVLTTVVSATSDRLLIATSTISRSLCGNTIGGGTDRGDSLLINGVTITIITMVTFFVTLGPGSDVVKLISST